MTTTSLPALLRGERAPRDVADAVDRADRGAAELLDDECQGDLGRCLRPLSRCVNRGLDSRHARARLASMRRPAILLRLLSAGALVGSRVAMAASRLFGDGDDDDDKPAARPATEPDERTVRRLRDADGDGNDGGALGDACSPRPLTGLVRDFVQGSDDAGGHPDFEAFADYLSDRRALERRSSAPTGSPSSTSTTGTARHDQHAHGQRPLRLVVPHAPTARTKPFEFTLPLEARTSSGDRFRSRSKSLRSS